MNRAIRLLLAALLALLPAAAFADGTYNKPGGGGVVLVTKATIPATGNTSLTYRLTNASSASDCNPASATGSSRSDCRWNGSNYEPVGVAASGLTNPLTSNLSGAGFDVTGVDDVNTNAVNQVFYPGTSATLINNAIAACGVGSGTANQGCAVVLPDGLVDIDATIVVGGATLGTMQNAVQIHGRGAGIVNSVGQELAGTTLRWVGADGGTMMRVSGFGHVIDGIQFDGRSCVDRFSTGGPPQVGGSPDGKCDTDGTTSQVQAAYGVVQIGDNAASAPAGKNLYKNLTIAGIVDTGVAAGGWAFSFGAGTADVGQNDHTILENVRMVGNRHCLRQSDTQAVANEIRMPDCTGFTESPGYQINRGGIVIDGGFIGSTVANADYIAVDYCATEVTVSNVNAELQGDNSTFYGATNNFAGACGLGNTYTHRIEGNRVQYQTDATIAHKIFRWPSQASLYVAGNTWTNNGANANRRASMDFTYAGTRNRYIKLVGNRTAWNSGADSTDPVVTVDDSGAGRTRVSRDDLGRVELIDKDGKQAIAKDATGIFFDVDDDGAFDLFEPRVDGAGSSLLQGLLIQNAPPDRRSGVSPAHLKLVEMTQWFAIDGQKSPVEGEGCTAPGVPYAGCTGWGMGQSNVPLAKTKSIGLEQFFVNLTETEAYGHYWTHICGGDCDAVGLDIDVFSTGGAHAGGDEGSQNVRLFNLDTWLLATGSVDGAIASGAGTSTVSVSGISPEESKMMGEGKLLVFTGSPTTITLVDVPQGVLSSSEIPEAPGGAAGVWTAGAGQLSGIAANGFCFASTLSSTTDINGNSHKIYLQIESVSGDTFTTRREAQGRDDHYPQGYRADEGASAGVIVPCVEIVDAPTFGGADGHLVTGVTVKRAPGFPGTGANASFEVGPYPGIRQAGVNLLIANKLGTYYGANGFQAYAYADGTAAAGRYQLRAAFDPGTVTADGLSPEANLVDGARHGWAFGMPCDMWECQIGFAYYYTQDPTDLYFDQVAMRVAFADEDWDDDVAREVIRNWGRGASSLSVKKGDGWGQGLQGSSFEAFLRASVTSASINSGVPNGAGAKVHWSQLLGVPPGFADGSDDGSGGGGNLDGLSDVVITSPATGAAFRFNGTNWVNGPLDLADTDAVSGVLPDANVADNITASNYLALAGGNITGVVGLNSGASIDVKTGATISSSGGLISATAMAGSGTIDDNDLAAGAVDGGTGGEIEDATVTAADLGTASLTAADAAADLATQAELDALTLPASGQTGNRIVKSSGTAGDLVESGLTIDASQNVTGAANFTATGTVAAPVISASQPTGTNVPTLVFTEGATDGSNTVTIQGPSGGFSADRTCTLQDDATPLDNCVSGGVGGGAPTDASYFVGAANGTLSAEVVAGSGVATAFAINVGSAGSFVTNGGALGTPSSGNASNLTNIPAANVTGNLDLAGGTIRGAVSIEATTSTGHTLAAARGQWLFADETGTTTITLPAKTSGASVCIYPQTDQQVIVDPNGTDIIVLNGTALTGGNKVQSPVAGGNAGNFACLLSNGSNWYVLGKAGTWTDGGP